MAEYTQNGEQGICPKCKVADLVYGRSVFNDYYMGFEWVCGECNAAGVEWYSLEFIENVVNEEEDYG